jgi:hypothetical protein
MPGIDSTRLPDLRFRIRTLQYNTYEIDHPEVNGQLRLLAIPTNILQVSPEDLARMGAPANTPGNLVGTQAVVCFTSSRNRGPLRLGNPEEIRTAPRVDLTNFVQDSNEPWNEFALQGDPPIILRTRTILTRVDWIRGFTDSVGGPALSVNHDTTFSVRPVEAGEAGMR